MAQHDYVIANASGATVRADINSALSAIQTLNSGTSAPSSTAAGMLWLDTTGGAPYVLKVRDAGNNHWLTLASVTDPGADDSLTLTGDFNGEILSTATFPAGSIINYKFVEIGVLELSGTYTPFNVTTAATSSQGLQAVTTSFTPKSDNSKIFCQAQLFVQEDSNSGDWAMSALFVDTNILSQQINNDRAMDSNLEHVVATLSGEYTNSSTSAKTIQIRVSGDTNKAIDVNPYNRLGAKSTSGYISSGLSIFEVQQ